MTEPRHILFVSPYFPPFSPVGAVRMPAQVGHWRRQGIEVTVLAVLNSNLGGAHTSADDGAVVHHLPFEGSATAAAPTPTPGVVGAPRKRETKRPNLAKRLYREIMLTPDRYRGEWVRRAADEGIRIAHSRPVDLIMSSGPPQSAHLAAARIAKATGIPWIAEMRDLWIGNPYDDKRIAGWWNYRLAAKTLAGTTAFVTVTAGAAKATAERFGKPVEIAYNGYEADEFDGVDGDAPFDPAKLTIVHAGVIYARRRDPSALFEAIARLGDRKDQVRALFFHDEQRFVGELARRFGVEAQVEIRPLVTRAEILKIERQVDVLLLCRWDDPRDDAVIPGKVFEYIGARRPILAVGSETGEAADIVRAGGFGLVSNDPAVIGEQLSRWIDLKAANGGRLPDVSSTAYPNYGRGAQFNRIDKLIAQTVAPR